MKLKSVCVLVVLGILVLWTHSASAMPKPNPFGIFSQADFTPPDFADGDTATVPAGETRTFTASCTCARQPGTAPCDGSIVVEKNDGGGFDQSFSVACVAAEGESCSSSYDHLFGGAGVFEFRIVCDEEDGTDFTQDPSEYVTVTVEGAVACTDGETRLCPLQDGVCAGSEETCTGDVWPGCDYSVLVGYEEPEASCDDQLDNDCDGRVDYVDWDGDGFGICPRAGIINELLVTSLESDGGVLKVFEYHDGTYEEAWSIDTSAVTLTRGGGEAGDLTGDGTLEFVIGRSTSGGYAFEVWGFDGSAGWYRLWRSPTESLPLYVGDIDDYDNDGALELLVTNRGAEALEIYGWDGNGFVKEATVRDCAPLRAMYHAASGDLNNDGTPEILFQCERPEDMMVHEYDGNGYPFVGTIVLPPHGDTIMLVDDMEGGDVDGDGVDEMVFCGSTGRGYVATFTGTNYTIEYETPAAVASDAFTQTCSVGDVTNDGTDDFFVVNKEGAKVYSHDGSQYQEIWVGQKPTSTPGIGSSGVGDADNDGFTEFLFADGSEMLLYENDVAGANSFQETASLTPLSSSYATALVANLNPNNDEPQVDCDDTNPDQGLYEICGDGVDNDCDEGVDEYCPMDFCGDNYCAGDAAGEMCTTCPDDCGCFGPDCRHGCCGDGVCGRKENATNCPVDCS